MRVPCGDVVHVGLEVLDHAVVVGGDQVAARVVVAEGSDGGVVCLEDGLEVEGEAVP